MTVYEKLAELRIRALDFAATQESMIKEYAPGSALSMMREDWKRRYLQDAEALAIVMDEMPAELAGKEIA